MFWRILQFGIQPVAIIIAMALPDGTSPPDFTLAINVVKVGAWIAIAAALWKGAREFHAFYQAVMYITSEHRMVVGHSRQLDPERWNEFDLMFGDEFPMLGKRRAINIDAINKRRKEKP